MHTLRAAVCAATLLAASVQADIAVPGGMVDLQFTRPPSAALRGVATAWVERSARGVSMYYGSFPVRRVLLRITPTKGSGAEGGQTFGWDGALIKIGLGRASTAADVADDWILTHEMVHLAFPSVAERHHWIEEGLATYVEPIARLRAGIITPERVWNDLVEGLPQGQPAAGDRGLDYTPTWGRTYWGGALFCLRADVETRRRTGNRRGLEDAMRAVLAASGGIESSWEMDRVIAVGDAATGVPVLRELYDEMKATPVTVDLAALWQQLGVIHRGHTVTFDDSAPLAGARQAITRG